MLRRLRRRRDLALIDMPAPEAADVLRLPELQTVAIVRLRCGTPDCARVLGAQLLRARPFLDIRVDGVTLSPAP